MLENYKKLCVLFYDTDKPFPPPEEYLFYLSYCEYVKNDILEPMCGSGRYLIPLTRAGFKIDAFDASQFMLSSLHSRIISEDLCQGDFFYTFSYFKDYIFEKKYNLIFIPSASFGLLTSRDEAVFALQKIYDSLHENGFFVFEVETSSIFRIGGSEFEIISNKILSIPNTDSAILGSFVNNSFKNGVLEILCRYDFIQNNRFSFSEQEKIFVRLYSLEEISQLLFSVGFLKFKIYKNFQKELLLDGDPLPEVLIIECKKYKQ